MTYTTKQRTLLSEFLQTHAHAHVSIREILDFARINGIGTATVYRFLDKLIKEGKLCKYTTDSNDGGSCYQWRDADCRFYHFICADCGTCYHVECPQLAAVHAHISEHHAFQIQPEKTVFRGRCAACIEKETL